MKWEKPDSSLSETATVAIAKPSDSTEYRINDFGDDFSLVCLIKRGTKGLGTTNYHLGDYVSLVDAEVAAQSDWDSGARK